MADFNTTKGITNSYNEDIKNINNTYNPMINNSDQYYNNLINASNEYADKQVRFDVLAIDGTVFTLYKSAFEAF